MNKKHNIRTRTFIAGFLLAQYAGTPVMAEDIEIYTTLTDSTVDVQPNIMFILDSSGSMNEEVLNAQFPYDPATVYSGCYDTAVVYYTNDGDAPRCNSGDYFDVAALSCDHAVNMYDDTGAIISSDGPLDTAGYYTGQMGQLNESRSTGQYYWDRIRVNRASDRSKAIECEQDAGIHGSNSAPTPNTWIVDGGTGYQGTDSNHVIWAGGGNNYTIFTGNYLNYIDDTTNVTTSTRFEELKTSILALTDANTNINIGLMQFDTQDSEGGPVIYAVEDINAARNDFQSRVKTMNANGATPLSETYWEALRYFGGRTIEYGKTSNPSTQTGAKENGNPTFYQTPIASTCQKNAIIYLSDGAPSYDHMSTDQVNDLPGFTQGSCATNGGVNDAVSDPTTSCLPYFAQWAANEDVAFRSDIPEHEDEQNITTYTVGFDFTSGTASEQAAEELLQRTALLGGGSYKTASNAAELSLVFAQIIQEILAVNTTFSSPAVSVNAFNRSTNLDDLYFTLFKPSIGEHWNGNLKKYKLDFRADSQDSDGDGNTDEVLPFIIDADGNFAIDFSSGFFDEDSKSFWTDGDADGDEAKDGGAAGELTNTRNVYTISGSYSDSDGVNVPSNGDLTASVNALDKANSDVTEAMLGIVGVPEFFTGTPYRETLLDWAYGLDVLDEDGDGSRTDARQIMGDPLHSEPALVQYGVTSGGEPDLVAYMGTNDGYLHAIDSLSGQEYFAFLPQEELPDLDAIFVDDGTMGKAYGIDGNIVPWIQDTDSDGTIEAGEAVDIFFSQRRGGNNIYSMDVTDRNSPVLNWVIKGGTGDFAALGDTWSTINVEKLMLSGVEKTVLVFGGGYDVAQDVVTQRTGDSIGAAIFIVDAVTGERLWWAGGPGSGADLELDDMIYSIPGRVKPLDLDRDGSVDRLYLGDMGGQLWRIDIPSDDLTAGTLSSEITGYKLADLAADGAEEDNRRFFYPPDAALIVEQGKLPYIAVLGATGYRAHPLNKTIEDRIYMIRDENVYTTPATTPAAVTEADLFDTTDNLIGEGSDAQRETASDALSTSKGWYIKLNQLDGSFIGEKSLSEPLILAGVGVVTTFIPEDLNADSGDPCIPREGTGSVFYVNITDGTPTYDLSGNDDKTREDRKVYLKRGGIPPSPSIIVTEQGTAQCIGTECEDARLITNIQKTIYYEKEL